MTQEDAIAAVVAVLDGLQIPYMVAGSFASSLHGVPRMTNDADIVIDADETAALRIVRPFATAPFWPGWSGPETATRNDSTGTPSASSR